MSACEDQPDKLDRKRDPKEGVELQEALVDLIVRVHLLHPSVRAKELVNLPAKLMVDLPPKAHVYELGYRYDDRNNGSQDIDGDVGNALRRIGKRAADFGYLDYCIDQEQRIEDSMVEVSTAVIQCLAMHSR